MPELPGSYSKTLANLHYLLLLLLALFSGIAFSPLGCLKYAFCSPISVFLSSMLSLVLVVAVCAALCDAGGSFTISNNNFYLNGEEFRILSGYVSPISIYHARGSVRLVWCSSLHYARVHPAYWRDRLTRMRAMGLNAVQTCMVNSVLFPMQVYAQAQFTCRCSLELAQPLSRCLRFRRWSQSCAVP